MKGTLLPSFNEEKVLISSSELATANKSIQFMIRKVQNCLICLLHTAKYFPWASFFYHLSLFSKMSLWLLLKNKKAQILRKKIHLLSKEQTTLKSKPGKTQQQNHNNNKKNFKNMLENQKTFCRFIGKIITEEKRFTEMCLEVGKRT